jgi:hypothetical protein
LPPEANATENFPAKEIFLLPVSENSVFPAMQMDTFFKVLSGVLLGVVICFGWDFYETQEAANKGLKPGWVPVNAPDSQPAPKPDSKPAAEPEVARAPAAPPPEPAPPPPPPPPPAAPKPVGVNFPKLAAEPWRWPARTTLATAINIPLMEGANVVGGIPLSAKTEVEVVRVFANGQLHARAQGRVFAIRAENTDLAIRILPEGTPRPAPRPRPVFPVKKTPVKSPARPANAPVKPANTPAEEPQKGGTLFGIPIQ